MDLIKLPQFPSVAAGGISTLVTDRLLDRSIHALIFRRGGTTFNNAHMSNIRLRLDGKDVVNGITGSQLVDLNDYEGTPDVTGETLLPFGDLTARTVRGQHLGDIDCSIYRRPIEIEVAIAAGASAPTLEAWALCGPPKMEMGYGYNANEASQLRALIRTVIQPAAAIQRKSYGLSLGSGAGARLRRAFFFHTNLTSVEFMKNSQRKWDDVPTALNSAIAQYFARVPQVGLYALDRIVDGNQGEAETTVRADGTPWSLEVNLTTSGADTITAFADVYTTHPQL